MAGTRAGIEPEVEPAIGRMWLGADHRQPAAGIGEPNGEPGRPRPMGSGARSRTLPFTLVVAVGLAFAGCVAYTAGRAGDQSRPLRPVAYRDCSDLLTGLRRATAAHVGPYGLRGADGPVRLDAGRVPGRDGGVTAAPQARQHSTTNVHEAGVDEPDRVKTDGRRIITTAQGRLWVVDAATRRVTGILPLPGGRATSGADLLMSGDRVLVISRPMPVFRREDIRPVPPGGLSPRITLVDIAGPPRIVGSLTTKGAYVDARQVGSTVQLVLRSSPDIRFPEPPPGTDSTSATTANRKAVERAPLDAWLPSYEVTADGRTQQRTVPCDQVRQPASATGTSMLEVFTVDLAAGLGDAAAAGVAAAGDTVYGTGTSLYIADRLPRRTDLYRFDTRGAGRPTFAAAGSVPGGILNQYSLSEYGGKLRVAATRAGRDSSVYVLAQHGPRLETVGRIDGLGRGERVYAVRFVGPVGYVVTFRQVDPLYTIDLRNPEHPRTAGALKITGYSAYLHPAGGGRLIGVGQDADTKGRTLGVQVSLFDVTDPARPQKVGGYRVGSGVSMTESDPHAFLYWPDTGLTVVPTLKGALVLSVRPGSVHRLGTVRPPREGTLIERSLLVGATLWTLTSNGLQSNDAATLRTTSWLPFS